MVYCSEIISTGSYLPSKIVTNHDLEKIVETSHDWIVQRTGIERRHIADEKETTSDMALSAAKDCLNKVGFDSNDLDLIILATTTPDYTFPATATKVQAALGMKSGAAFDLQAVCAGFIYGLSIADQYIKTGFAKNILVIGAETFSRILDWEDRRTCILFGDGAGAVLLQAKEVSEGHNTGILSSHIFSDGRYVDILKTTGGPSFNQTVGLATMEGKEVFKHAVKDMAESINIALQKNKLTHDDLDWVIPHQANQRIIDAVSKKLEFSKEKTITTVADHANTSAASIPLALDRSNQKNIFKSGDLIAMTAFGAGLSWGSVLLRWK